MTSSSWWTTLAGVLAGVAVALGAYAAHGLDTYFVEKYEGQTKMVAGNEVTAAQKYLADFETGVRYQMYHSLALLAVGVLAGLGSRKLLHLAGWTFLLGTILFSGSLYVHSVAGPNWSGVSWGLITPFGGALLIIGWVFLALAACPCSQPGAKASQRTVSQAQQPASQPQQAGS